MVKKGEIKKLKVNPNTLSSGILGKALEAVSLLNNREPYYLVGGIATQSYLPPFCRRPTSDIDISIVKPLNYVEFKSIVKPIIEYLEDEGYLINSKKYSRSFCLNVLAEDNEKMIIEFSRRNDQSFNKSKNRLERELDNSKKKEIGVGRAICYVATTEDIVIPKLVRSVGSLIRNPDFKNILPKKTEFSIENIQKKLDKINNLREYAMLKPGNLITAEKLRFISDIYDMDLLYKFSGINENYFEKVMKEWDTLSENESQKDFLINFIFHD